MTKETLILISIGGVLSIGGIWYITSTDGTGVPVFSPEPPTSPSSSSGSIAPSPKPPSPSPSGGTTPSPSPAPTPVEEKIHSDVWSTFESKGEVAVIVITKWGQWETVLGRVNPAEFLFGRLLYDYPGSYAAFSGKVSKRRVLDTFAEHKDVVRVVPDTTASTQ